MPATGELRAVLPTGQSIDVDIQGSPYRDFDMQTIVNAIMRLSDDAVVFVFGASLGANNSPVIVHALNHHRNVDGPRVPRGHSLLELDNVLLIDHGAPLCGGVERYA
jgi:hypothetical protein